MPATARQCPWCRGPLIKLGERCRTCAVRLERIDDEQDAQGKPKTVGTWITPPRTCAHEDCRATAAVELAAQGRISDSYDVRQGKGRIRCRRPAQELVQEGTV
jgi:hypothetical protein